jgi:serine/threonine-protein kinase SRPK3
MAELQATLYVESLDDYRKSGLHPIHLGDHLGGKYVVIDKLGHGDISTV